MEKTIEQASIFKEELTEILIDGEDTMPVSDIDQFNLFLIRRISRQAVPVAESLDCAFTYPRKLADLLNLPTRKTKSLY